jgi:hypothetical protein
VASRVAIAVAAVSSLNLSLFSSSSIDSLASSSSLWKALAVEIQDG